MAYKLLFIDFNYYSTSFFNADIRIKAINKLIIASLFIAGLIFIETGLYLGWNPVGQKYIIDVQGRYFIPYAPSFFFYYIILRWVNILIGSLRQVKRSRLEFNKKSRILY